MGDGTKIQRGMRSDRMKIYNGNRSKEKQVEHFEYSWE